MIPTFLIALAFFAQTTVLPVVSPVMNPISTLGQAQFSLLDRYSNTYVSNVFAENILLTLYYMRGNTITATPDWNEVKKPFSYSFTLNPGQVFAFHQDSLPQFAANVVKTTNAHFGSQEGFVSDGYLVADGVCHLASLINEAGQNAGLTVVAPTNHNFAVIPEVDKKYGTAIYYMPGEKGTNEEQNLYVQNNKDKPVTFTFDYDGTELKIRVTEATSTI